MSFTPLFVNSGGGTYDESDDIKIDFGIDAAKTDGVHTYTVPINYKWKILGITGRRTEAEGITIYLSDGSNNHVLDGNLTATTIEIHWNAAESIIIPYGWTINISFATSAVAGSLISSILYIETLDW